MAATAEPTAIQKPVFTPDGKPIGTRLSELPIPEKYRQQIEDDLRSRKYRGTKRDWLWVVNYPKLCMYYPNEDVLYYNEDDDFVVLAHSAVDGMERIGWILRNVTEEQGRRLTLATTELYDQ